MIHFLGSYKRELKLVLVAVCCAPHLLVAQNGFDPFATEFPPEVESRPQTPEKQPQLKRTKPRQNSRKQSVRKPPIGNGHGEKRKKTSARKLFKPKTVQPKIEPPEPSYISGSLDFKVDVGLEHNFIVSGFEPSVDFANLTSDQIRSDFFSAEEILYPTLRLTGGRGLVIQARPALSALLTRYRKKNQRQGVDTKLNAETSELFVSIQPSGRFSLQVGRQNFQWGLAELGSPSNWIFRSDKFGDYFTKSPQSRVETRDLVKASLSFGQSVSLIAMSEYESQTRDRPQIYQGRRAALKSEFAWNDAANSVGVIVGAAEQLSSPFLGEYFSLALGEAFSLYGDASHTKGSPVAKPVVVQIPEASESQRIIVFDQPELSSDTYHHEAILGLKYTFLSGLELRIEGAYSSVGLTNDELDLVAELESSSSPLLPVFFAPGIELRSETAAFVGLKRAGFGRGGRWTLLGRYFVPIYDGSGGLFGYGEYLFSDNAVLFLSAGGYHGSAVSQSAFPRRWSISIGQKYVW